MAGQYHCVNGQKCHIVWYTLELFWLWSYGHVIVCVSHVIVAVSKVESGSLCTVCDVIFGIIDTQLEMNKTTVSTCTHLIH